VFGIDVSGKMTGGNSTGKVEVTVVKQQDNQPIDKHSGSLSGKTWWSLQSCGGRSGKI